LEIYRLHSVEKKTIREFTPTDWSIRDKGVGNMHFDQEEGAHCFFSEEIEVSAIRFVGA
jgi:hypothetical protein